LYACRGGAAHAEVAREEHTTRYQVGRAFATCGDELQARRQARPPRRLSLDEAHHRRRRELATVVSDLDRRRVIEVLDGCQRRVIERWLMGLPAQVREGIEVVSIDPSEAYRQAIRAALPHDRIVCDRFHLVRGANTALHAVRRERQREAHARRPKGTRRSGQHVSWRPGLYQARARASGHSIEQHLPSRSRSRRSAGPSAFRPSPSMQRVDASAMGLAVGEEDAKRGCRVDGSCLPDVPMA
jgi:transposase